MPVPQVDMQHIAKYTAPFFSVIAGKKLFVTGGTGLFGKWLLESFITLNEGLNLNAQVYVLSRKPEIFLNSYPYFKENKSLRFMEGDIASFDFPDEDFEYIIHAAADTSQKLDHENPSEMEKTIVSGAARIAEFAVRCNAKRILFTSSGAVYGIQPPNILNITEDYLDKHKLIERNSAYSRSKRVAEQIFLDLYKSAGVETVIARCFAFVGPYLDLDVHFAVGNFIRDVLQGKTIVIKGDGTPYRSYMYMADLAVWLWTILIKGAPGRIYNVGSDVGINIADLAEKVSNSIVTQSGIDIMQKAVVGQKPQRYVPSIDRARNELGLEIRIGLDDAIKRTIDFYRN